jgi:transposase-like protein
VGQTSAEQRAKWVERWRDSGLTAQEFAAEAGLKATALYYWSSQLSASARVDPAGQDESTKSDVRSRRSRAARSGLRSLTPSSFVELPVAAASSASVMLELVVGEVRVLVAPGFDEVTLTRVVRALEAAR